MARTTVYNDLTSPEKIDKISDENKQLIDEFIIYLQSLNRASSTVETYTNDLHIFFCWNVDHNNNKFFVELTKRDIMKYQNYLINTLSHSSSRVRRLKATLSSMSNFIGNILDEEYPNFQNIINKIPSPDLIPVREKTVLDNEQVEYLLKKLVADEKYQQACVVALATASGARKVELLRFKTSYFNKENIIHGFFYKTPEKIKTKGRSNQGKMIHKYVIVDKFKPYFDLWMEEQERLGIKGEELFWSRQKGKWQPAKVSLLDSYTKIYSKILGVPVYMHCFRHFFTTYLSEAGIPATVIKDIVGWENLDMVDTYIDTEVDDQLGKYFSEDGIIIQEDTIFNEWENKSSKV